MKKFTKVLALTLVVIMSVLTLVACATPAKDPKDAKKALEDNKYTIVTFSELDEATDDGVIAMLAATKKDEYITIAWYEDAKSAKEAYNDAKEELKEMKEELEENKDKLGDDYDEQKEALDKMVVGKSGKMVWMASSKDAVKAAK